MCSEYGLTERNIWGRLYENIALRVSEIWSGNELKGKFHDFEN